MTHNLGDDLYTQQIPTQFAADKAPRVSARYLLLHYKDIPKTFDVNEIRRLAVRERARCTISTNTGRTSANCLAFVDFSGKRFQTRNRNIFDVQGIAPSWHPVTSEPWKAYDMCSSLGTVVVNEAPRPSRKTAARRVTENGRPVKNPRGFSLMACANFAPDFLQTVEYTDPASSTSIADSTASLNAIADAFCHNAGALPRSVAKRSPTSNQPKTLEADRRVWGEGYRAGFSAGISYLMDTEQRGSLRQLHEACKDREAQSIFKPEPRGCYSLAAPSNAVDMDADNVFGDHLDSDVLEYLNMQSNNNGIFDDLAYPLNNRTVEDY